jgi:hypothetical protein
VKLTDLPFRVTDWSQVAETRRAGDQGFAEQRAREVGPFRVRLVDYTPGYRADHWCEKGHLVFCLAGELRTELADGRTVVLSAGMSYEVGDGTMAHRSTTPSGARLLIVD